MCSKLWPETTCIEYGFHRIPRSDALADPRCDS
jgi:hypothetical protein